MIDSYIQRTNMTSCARRRRVGKISLVFLKQTQLAKSAITGNRRAMKQHTQESFKSERDRVERLGK